MQVAIENHTDTFADEILWIVDKLNHPLIGTCVDTMNPLQVIENPHYAMEKMLPRAFCCHFSDDVIDVYKRQESHCLIPWYFRPGKSSFVTFRFSIKMRSYFCAFVI